MEALKERILPLTLSGGVVMADQISKFLMSRLLPYARPVEVLGDFLRLTYVQNPVIAFSLGRNMPPWGRHTLTLVLPLIVLGILGYYTFFAGGVTRAQRWILAAIIGGGLGNYLDRMFRPGGVIDFIDVKFYGLLGFSRWPTFNLADTTVVVAGLLLLATYFICGVKKADE